jgi:hypothetical protein
MIENSCMLIDFKIIQIINYFISLSWGIYFLSHAQLKLVEPVEMWQGHQFSSLQDQALINEITLLFSQRKFSAKTPPVEIKLVTNISSPMGKHLTFEQQYQGLPVRGCGIKVNLTNDNKVFSAYDYTTPIRPAAAGIHTTEKFDSLKSQEYIKSISNGTIFSSQWIWILTVNGLEKAYQIITAYAPGKGSTEYLLGIDGQILYELSRNIRFRPSYNSLDLDKDTTAKGYIFDPDPLTSERKSYGGAFRDNKDSTNASLNAARKEVILKHILFDENTQHFKLNGKYVKIEEIDAPATIIPKNETAQFFYNRSENEFESIMCHYHITSFQEYIQSLGFDNLWNKPLKVDPHGKIEDQSLFIPLGDNSYLLFGDGGVDDAEDADVILHEYAHAISNAASPNTNDGTERRGLDEGFGDYFAATYSRKISDYQWEKVFNWDGGDPGGWGGRSAASEKRYDPSKTSIYYYGEVWNSALMAAWTSIGPLVLDKIILQFMYTTVTNMKLEQAAQGVLRVDSLINQGNNYSALAASFCEYGILSPVHAICTSLGTGPFTTRFQPVIIYPNPAISEIYVRLFNPIGRKYEFELINTNGQLIKQDISTGNEAVISLVNIATGIYFLRIYQAETGFIYSSKIQVLNN